MKIMSALILGLASGSVVAAAAPAPQADFVVAPNGRDDWSGRRAAPNAGKTDGPFATLPRAQEAVRALKQAEPGRQRPIVVLVRAGTYYLKEPLLFKPEDSGTEKAPVLYAAYPGEKPVISGGTRLSGWKKQANGWWQTQLPEVQRGEWYFTQLYMNGHRRQRPRLPRDGYARIAGEVPPSPAAQGKGFDRFRYAEGDIPANMSNVQDVEALCFHIWAMSRFRLASIEPETRTVTFTGHTASAAYWASLPKGNRYLLENVREALGAPGEWYLDRKTGILTYIPMAGETPTKAEAFAPRLEKLVQLQGDVAGRRWVEHLTFRGLTFAHTSWALPAEGYAFPQAEVALGGAITAVGARDCALEGCTLTKIATYAVEFGEGCRNDRVDGCVISDIGAGGVKIGTQGIPGDEEAVASHNVVRNTLIAHLGRTHPAAVGVWIGQSPNNTIEHNAIHDLYYTGISIGWTWGYGKSLAHDNIIEYNDIYDIGQGVLSDMGGTYTLGVSPGSVQRNNRIHDVESFDYGGWGIYFDEGTTGMLAENNIVYRTKAGSFHQHYGRENVVRNNIFALSRQGQLIRTRAEEHLSFTLERNIVWWEQGPLLGSNWSGNNYNLDYNLYWNAAGQPVRFGADTFDKWQARGKDVHGMVADPLFVNPEKGDFRLKAGSPALKLGFQPIDASKIGRLPGALPEPAGPFPRAFSAPPEPKPLAIHEDFEATPVGQKAADAVTNEENAVATIRVTDETAATGKHSLKFVDAPGQKFNYNPHLFYNPGFNQGRVVGSFDLRVEAGTLLYHEWRDGSSPYQVGPSVRVEADGALMAAGRKVAQLPAGKWVHFEIACGLGTAANGKWDLAVTLPGQAPIALKGLPCNPAFRELRWYGFTADADAAGVFYLDNLHLDEEKR